MSATDPSPRKLNPYYPVLDHGFVRLVEHWGDGDAEQMEAGIIEAARQSTQGSFRGWEQDQRLLAHLYNNKHSTPFEFAGMVLEVKAPIMVFREWMRSRTQSYNEMSARYAPVPNEHYVPSIERVMMNLGGSNKQAGTIKDAEPLQEARAADWIHNLQIGYEIADREYQTALTMGIPKELARLNMPVGRYSQMRASANLRNWLGFLTLRLDPLAQWEIRQYAESVLKIVLEVFPQTGKLFQENRVNPA